MINHLAIIMDGNRRWAKKRSLMPWLGHRQGTQTVQQMIEYCLESNIKYLSLYTFSLENFNKRSQEEQDYLFEIIIQESEKGIDNLIKNGVRVRFLGDAQYFPTHVKPSIRNLEFATQNCEKLILNILFYYGAKQEIVAAIKEISKDVQLGKLNESDINQDTIKSYFWTHGTPDPELIVRTGGVKRLSNFLLYQAAYSEFFFLDCLWPDLSKQDLAQITKEFEERQRNFGA